MTAFRQTCMSLCPCHGNIKSHGDIIDKSIFLRWINEQLHRVNSIKEERNLFKLAKHFESHYSTLPSYPSPCTHSAIYIISSQEACIFVSVSIHYFYLVGFAWMLMEGIYLYLKVVEVFYALVKIEHFYVFSWGMLKCMFDNCHDIEVLNTEIRLDITH